HRSRLGGRRHRRPRGGRLDRPDRQEQRNEQDAFLRRTPPPTAPPNPIAHRRSSIPRERKRVLPATPETSRSTAASLSFRPYPREAAATLRDVGSGRRRIRGRLVREVDAKYPRAPVVENHGQAGIAKQAGEAHAAP